MGFFSWKTSDTHKSISNKYSKKGTFTVYVLCPDGTKLKEKNYEGYGDFGGRDIYALVAQWNRPELCKDKNGNFKSDDECRWLGIDIAYSDELNFSLKYPIKIVENGDLKYEEVEPSLKCSRQD
jgi:hypothetical protein